MSYLKISHTNIICNQILMKCIKFIGTHYVGEKYVYRHGKKMSMSELEKGVGHLAQKCGTSKRAVRNMYFSEHIKNSDTRQWCFEQKKYIKVYRLILKELCAKNEYDFVKELCESVVGIYISDILFKNQKSVLEYGIRRPRDNNEYYKKMAERILNNILLIDEELRHIS